MSLVTTTPKLQTAIATAPLTSTPSPGTWRHPRFGEITRRKNAATFDGENVRKLVWNGGALLLLWILDRFMDSKYASLMHDYSWLLTQSKSRLSPYRQLSGTATSPQHHS